MITADPPAATTSAAVSRPIPLLPPTTTSFWPSKTGIACGWSGSSVWWCRPCSQLALIQALLSAACVGGKPAACVPASLAAHRRSCTVRSDIRNEPTPPSQTMPARREVTDERSFPERGLAHRHAMQRAQAGSCTEPPSVTPRGLSERAQIADLRPLILKPSTCAVRRGVPAVRLQRDGRSAPRGVVDEEECTCDV